MHKRSANHIVVLAAMLLVLRLSVAGIHASPYREGGEVAGLDAYAALPPGVYAGPAKPWIQVNDDAFGLGDPSNQSPPYQSEDGFEVTVYNDQLYVGMEADDLLGARLWRTKAGVAIPRSQADWEQVVDDAFGDVDNNDHIDSIQGFGDHIYASTAQSNYNSGTEVWRSSSGALGSWTQVNVDGFGDFRNLNFKDMAVLDVGGTKWLCGGTLNVTRGPQVWCTVDGETWELKNPSWRNLGGVGYIKIWSTGVMDGHLYVGTECSFNGACPGAVWRTDGTADGKDPSKWAWERVFDAPVDQRVDIIGEFDAQMYIGFDGGNGTEVWRSNTGGTGTWGQVNIDGFGDPNNGRLIVDAGTIYNDGLYHNGLLYVATLNQATGAQVWRTVDGTTWTHIGDDGFGNANTFAAELASFNGYLYAWATNYESGQKVLRTKVPVCQQSDIDSPGLYTFAGVGAEVKFVEENLDSLEVCVYPNASPEKPSDDKSVKRHYELNPSPEFGTFTADLTLSYTDDEFAASGIGVEETTYLLRWTGNQWAPCLEGNRSRDTANNTVTCADVTAFSTWAMAGTDVAPTSTPTPTATATATGTSTSTPTSTATPTATSTPTSTATVTATSTSTSTPTSTVTPTATSTPTPEVRAAAQVRPVGGYGEPIGAIQLLDPWILLVAGVLSVTASLIVARSSN